MRKENPIKVFVSFIKPKWISYMVGLLGDCVVQSIFSIYIAFIFKDMTNAAISHNMQMLYRTSIIIGIGLVCISILVPLLSYTYNKSIKLAMAELRIKVFDHVQKLPASFFEKTHSGDIMASMTNDINVVEGVYSGSIRSLIFTIIRAVGSTISMFILNWRIALVIILLGVMSAFLNTRYSKSIGKISDKLQKEISNLTVQISSMFTGFGVIRIFNLSNIFNGNYKKINSEVTKYSIQLSMKRSMLESTNFLLNFFNFLGILTIGAFIVLQESKDFSSTIAIIQLQTNVTPVFLQIGSFMAQFLDSFAGAKRIKDLLETEVEPEKITINSDYSSDKMVEFKGVSMGYEEGNLTLEGIDISAQKGQFIAIVGPSGGGKSTITKLLQGFYPINSGSIILNGKPVSEYTIKQVRDMIAYIPQNIILFKGTIAENIKYGNCQATMDEVIAAAKAANAHEFIMEQPQGYDTDVGELGNRLSGGQKQRIAIARAFLKNSPIIIFDEATSALDNENEQLIQGTLNSLVNNRTRIVITHRLSMISKADMIYVINNGKVVETGTHDELMQKGEMYSNLFNMQRKLDENSLITA